MTERDSRRTCGVGGSGPFLPSMLVAALAAACSAASLSAQSSSEPASVPGGAVPSARAVPLQGPIELDGRLDEEAWSAAVPITEFTQNDPQEGAPVSEPTEVRVLYDDESLYIGARLHDSHPVSTRLGRRDGRISGSDWFSVSVDSYRDFRTAYYFRVNPSGVRSDGVLSGGGRPDSSWDPVWQSAVAITDSGWTVEMRIPFSQLRFRPADEHVWGMQIRREISRRQEQAVFSFTPKSESGGIARFGTLTGLRGIRPGSRMEVIPYLVGRASQVEVPRSDEVDFQNPFRSSSEFGARVGGDLKYRLTSNLTLDATVNPDFGQVEADPAEVNLSAFESRFGERRPFFVEGSDIFSFGGGGWGGVNLFYSRRIGQSPQVGRISDAVYADVPDASTILGAAKLTGRTPGGWSIGVLEAVTQREVAPYVDATGGRGTAVVEPLSNFLVARARREARQGQTLYGGIFTAVNRSMGEERIRSALRSDAYSAGVDFRHEWANRSWSLEGYLVGSHVRGESGVMLDAQLSPARYYQRPDALYLVLDSTATSLSGYAARIQLGKPAGEHWRGSVSASASSPGFEVNDLGYYYNSDRVLLDTDISYVENQPGRVFRNWRVSGGPGVLWNYGGDFLRGSSTFRAAGELLSYWNIEASVQHAVGSYDDRLTRGGPLARSPAETGGSLQIRSDGRRAVTGDAQVEYERNSAGGWEASIRGGIGLKPAPNWSLSLDPRYARSYSVAQYVGTVADPLATDTYGRRFLFSGLEQTTLSLRTRLDVVFSPDLTLEMYVEPFLASGDYDRVKELASPRTFDFDVYGEDAGTIRREGDVYRIDPDGDGPAASFTVRDRDFRRGSLNGNAVLRWEWRPGSTLFLVWQQARSVRNPVGSFHVADGFQDLWAERPDNVFLIKMSYWFSR